MTPNKTSQAVEELITLGIRSSQKCPYFPDKKYLAIAEKYKKMEEALKRLRDRDYLCLCAPNGEGSFDPNKDCGCIKGISERALSYDLLDK